MPIMNYTTDIAVEKTAQNITTALARRGALRTATLYDTDGLAVGFSFVMVTDYGPREFEMPVRIEGVLAAITRDAKVPKSKKTKEQAARVAWRIAEDWFKSQAALIDASLATLDEVMSPWMVDATGSTLYAVVREGALRALEAEQ